MHRMMFVDGTGPCVGKSVTAHHVALHLQRAGMNGRWFNEEDRDHPVHEWETKASRAWIARTLAKWREFLAGGPARFPVTVFESTLLQCGIGHLFNRDELDQGEIRGYFLELTSIIEPFCPAMVFLRPGDLRAAMGTLAEVRSQEWLDWYAEKWVASRPWAVARGLKGLDGAVAYLTALRDLEDGLLSEWPAPVLVVEPSVGDWEQRTKRILEFLGVPPSMESQPPAEAVRQIVGVYVDAAGEWLPRNGAEDIAVRSEAGGLYVYGLFWRRSRLVHVGGERYAVLGLPLDVVFEQGRSGAPAMRTEGRRIGTLEGRVFERQ